MGEMHAYALWNSLRVMDGRVDQGEVHEAHWDGSTLAKEKQKKTTASTSTAASGYRHGEANPCLRSGIQSLSTRHHDREFKCSSSA
jgi:hypothetical protein